MSRLENYRAANIRANEAKSAFLASLGVAKSRIAPSHLKADAKRKITEAVMDGGANAAAQIQARPIAFGAAASALLIFLMRKPLAALFRRLYVHRKPPDTGNSETEDV